MNPSLIQKLKENGWWEHLQSYFESDDWLEIQDHLRTLYDSEVEVFPKPNEIFRPLTTTKLDDVKVVILGQDPYPQRGAANGFAFSVNPGFPRPGSLRNIIKEMDDQMKSFTEPHKVTLNGWVSQGVLLLNTALTVEEGKPGSHAKLWNNFAHLLVKTISEHSTPKAFILWGNYARSFKKDIKIHKDLILEGAHPSPNSAWKFRGNDHFNKVNRFLKSDLAGRQEPIDWTVVDLVDLDGNKVNLPEWDSKDEAYERISECKY